MQASDPRAEKLAAELEGAANKQRKSEVPRAYIGASLGVGIACDANVAFSHRGFPEDPISPRLARIFALGHKIEDMVVADLKAAGATIWPVDPLTGKQWRYEDYGGHVRAHADGHIEIDGSIGILEIKGLGDKPFNEYMNVGVRRSHPKYFQQCQMLMGLSGLRWAMMVAVNKNDCRYHCEVVEFDEDEWNNIKGSVETIMHGEARKIASRDTDWRCRFCHRKGVCWHGHEVPKRCNTCKHAAPRDDGRWHCLLTDEIADSPCDEWDRYTPLPSL